MQNLKNKSREYYMVDCLFDEVNGALSNQRFTEWEIRFIKSLMAEFFNNEDYKLSPKQLECLDNIWER